MTQQYDTKRRLRMRRSLGTLCSCSHGNCRPSCVASYAMCDGLCGERYKEDPPMVDVALFGGAHIRKAL